MHEAAGAGVSAITARSRRAERASCVYELFGDTRETEVAATLAAAGHQVILVTSQDVPHRRNLETVRLPERPPAQRVVLEALAMQILVAEVAEQRAIEIEEFIFHNSDTKVPAGSSRE